MPNHKTAINPNIWTVCLSIFVLCSSSIFCSIYTAPLAYSSCDQIQSLKVSDCGDILFLPFLGGQEVYHLASSHRLAAPQTGPTCPDEL